MAPQLGLVKKSLFEKDFTKNFSSHLLQLPVDAGSLLKNAAVVWCSQFNSLAADEPLSDAAQSDMFLPQVHNYIQASANC